MLKISRKINPTLKKVGGEWGIYSKNLITGECLYALNEDKPFPSASVGKMPIAVYVFSQVFEGKASFEDEMILQDDLVLGGSGVLRYLHRGIVLTVLDVITLMLITSDNTAAKMLVRKFTPQKINAFMEKNGFQITKLKIDGDKFGFGMSTPKEMSTLLEGVYKNSYFSPEYTEKFIEILRHTEGDNRIRRHLPYDRYKEDLKLIIATKSGSIPGVRNEVGIVFEKTPYTLCVFGKDLKDDSNKVDNPAVLAIAEISKLIYENLVKSS